MATVDLPPGHGHPGPWGPRRTCGGGPRRIHGYDATVMRHPTRRPLTFALSLVALLAVVAACSGSATTAPGASPAATAATPDMPSAPAPTEMPGGSASPAPVPTPVSTTQTSWGTILDAVPDSFPVYPGAQVAGPPAEPVSAAYVSTDGVDAVAVWYRDALEALGFSTMSLSSPLEDGSRVLDTQGDLPECRIQTTFGPAGASTMITVLYAAGCAGGQG